MQALLEEESQEFPVLHGLKTLILEGCDLGVDLQALPGILQNTPGLEKLGLHHCTVGLITLMHERPSSVIFWAGTNLSDMHAPNVVNEPQFLGPTVRKRRKSGQQPSTSYVFWCQQLKSIEIKRRQEDEPHLDKVMLEISERMQAAQWQRVKTSSTIV
jgi:hypothetical protein